MCQKSCGTTVEREPFFLNFNLTAMFHQVTNALSKIAGVERAEASFAEGLARAWFSSGASPKVGPLIEAVEKVGFDASMASPPSVLLRVEGMMCQKNCGKTVGAALGRVEGVLHAEASFADAEARIWLADAAGAGPATGALVAAVEAVGFDCSVKEAKEARASDAGSPRLPSSPGSPSSKAATSAASSPKAAAPSAPSGRAAAAAAAQAKEAAARAAAEAQLAKAGAVRKFQVPPLPAPRACGRLSPNLRGRRAGVGHLLCRVLREDRAGAAGRGLGQARHRQPRHPRLHRRRLRCQAGLVLTVLLLALVATPLPPSLFFSSKRTLFPLDPTAQWGRGRD